MVIDLWRAGILPLGFIAGNLLAVMGSYFVKRKNLSLLERQLLESVRRGTPRNLLLRFAEEVRIATNLDQGKHAIVCSCGRDTCSLRGALGKGSAHIRRHLWSRNRATRAD